ncbi:MAG: acyltransferase family protein [Candidatus Sericytochromatia bacterium]
MNTVAHTASPRRGTPARAGRRREFRADIEGLRAVAVLAVVLYHAGFPGVTGGFIGVDVFFVISGFLITGLLWRDVSTRGRLRLLRFYGARARRLLPAAATVIVATAVVSFIVLPPLQARAVLGDAIACALYVGNYRFAVDGTDYLAANAVPSPLQHYWSLGVEEQFYLLWPALIIGTAWLVHRARRRFRVEAAPYVLVLAVVVAVSFPISMSWTHLLPSWAFFSLPTRAWELAVGGLVALTASHWKALSHRTATIAGWGGLALIVLTSFELSKTTPFPGVAALLPVFGTALVVGAGCAASDRGVGRALSGPVMRTIGRVSYSWYLWHWPVLLLAPPMLEHPLGLIGRLAATAVSLLFAVLTLGLIESPVRFAALFRRSAQRSLALGAAVTAVAVGVALVLLMIRPMPVGPGAAAAAVTFTPPTSTAGPPSDSVAQMTSQIQAAVAASAAVRAVPSNLSPVLSEAAGDKPTVFLNGCVRSWREVGQPDCASGDTASASTVALVGDSHAAMWSPAFENVASQRHWRLETLGKVTCPLMELPITSPYLGRQYTECEQWRADVLNRLAAERPRLIVVSMSRRYGADFGFTSYDPDWIGGVGRLVSRLRATGAAVLVLGPIPDPRSTVPICVSGHLNDAQSCSPARPDAVNDAGIAAEAAATAAGGGHYADLTSLFCTAQRCPVIVGNNLVYRDDNHVTTAYALALSPVIGAIAASAAPNL